MGRKEVDLDEDEARERIMLLGARKMLKFRKVKQAMNEQD